MKNNRGYTFPIIFCLLLLLGVQSSAQASISCECYKAGKQIGQRGELYRLPSECAQYIQGRMTPFRGGYFDGRYGNSNYFEESVRGGYGWCDNSSSSSSSSSSNGSSGSYSGSGSSSSGSSSGNYRGLQAVFYARGIQLATSAGCPPKYKYEDGGCYKPCEQGYTKFHSKYSELCVACPPGTSDKKIKLDYRGIPFCYP